MRISEPKTPSLTGTTILLTLLALSLASAPVAAELQMGRDSQGTLWISDQGLPAGVKSVATPDIEVATMSPAPSTRTNSISAPPIPATEPRTAPPGKPGRISQSKDKATCDGIDKRYEETRTNLARIEQEKASGKLLIPDSGMASLRQNLSTLERLRSLCL